MPRLTAPNGSVVNVDDEQVDRLVGLGFKADPKKAPAKKAPAKKAEAKKSAPADN